MLLLSWRLQTNPLWIPGALSFDWHCSTNSIYLNWDMIFMSQFKKTSGLCLGSAPCTTARKISLGGSFAILEITWLFSLCLRITVLHCCSMSSTPCFKYFVQFLISLKQEDKLSLCYSIMASNGIVRPGAFEGVSLWPFISMLSFHPV